MSRPLMTDADRVDVFRGLAHRLRRRVIKRLSEGELGVTEMAELLKVTVPALSRHLLILRETGLITSRLQHERRVYRLNGSAMQRVQRWVDGIKLVAVE